MVFLIEDEALTITLEPAEAFWSLKRKLAIPKASIERAQWHDSISIPRAQLGWRVGALIPGVLMAGRFYGPTKNFVYLNKATGLFRNIQAKHVLDINLRDYDFGRVLLTVDKPDIAEQIITWWSGNV